MHIGRQLSRVLAVLAVSFAVIGGGVTVASVPAVAHSPYEVNAEELEIICATFHGTFANNRDNYNCVQPEAEIACEALTQSCVYLTRAEMPRPFEDSCVRTAKGEFIITGPNAYACQLRWGAVLVECPSPDDKDPGPCVVGAIRSEVPVR